MLLSLSHTHTLSLSLSFSLRVPAAVQPSPSLPSRRNTRKSNAACCRLADVWRARSCWTHAHDTELEDRIGRGCRRRRGMPCAIGLGDESGLARNCRQAIVRCSAAKSIAGAVQCWGWAVTGTRLDCVASLWGLSSVRGTHLGTR